MANETRRRNDNVFGTLSSTMSSTGTTMNSAGLANLEAISSTEHAVIVIDPNRTAGAPEHVKVTAHTGSATSATIVRGQFGTSARAHSSTEDWVHAPIASNATSFASAANLQGDFVPMGAWQDYTPTFTNFTLGNGTINEAAFMRIGRTIVFRVNVTLGGSSSMGSSPTVSLPVAANATGSVPDLLGGCVLRDAGTANFIGSADIGSTTTAALWAVVTSASHASRAGVSSTVPFTWTTGDGFSLWGVYEAAA